MLFLAAARDGPATSRRVLAAVKAEPGVSKKQLSERLGLSWRTVDHHVRRHVAEGRIATNNDGWQHQLFPADTAVAERPWLRHFHAEDSRGFLEALRDGAALNAATLGARFGMSRKAVLTRLNHLRADGIVEKFGQVRPQYRLREPFPGVPSVPPWDDGGEVESESALPTRHSSIHEDLQPATDKRLGRT